MTRLSKQLASLLLLIILSGCGSFQTSDWKASITLPASLDCYSFNVMSGKETRLPADSKECMDKKIKSVWIDYENYKMLKADILTNCQYDKCKQITGAFDTLFLTIDNALKKIPGGK